MTKTNAQTAIATKAAKAKASKVAPKAAAVKATPVNKDVILQSSGAAGGEQHFVRSIGGETVTFPTTEWTGEIRKLASIGASFSALKAALAKLPKGEKPKAQLARGVQSNAAPHSAKAVSDQGGKAKASNKADAVTQKPKAAKAVSADDQRAIKVTEKGKAKLASGATTNAMVELAALIKAGTVAKARAAGFNMGAIQYAAKTGTITIG